MEFRQAEIYARELSELYRAERKRREELAEEKLVLEYKLRELSALNSLFQAHLEQRMGVEQAYRELVEEMKKLLEEGTAETWAESLRELVERAEARVPHLSQPPF